MLYPPNMNKIIPYTLVGLTFFCSGAGLGYLSSKQEMQKRVGTIAEKFVDTFEDYTDKQLIVYKFVEEGRVDEAKKVLEKQLEEQAIAAEFGLGALPSSKSISEDSKKRIEKVLLEQAKTLESFVKK